MTSRKSIAPIFIPFVAVLVIAAALPLPAGAARVADGLVALYDFVDVNGVTVADVSGVAPPLDLTVTNPGGVTWLPGSGLVLEEPTLVRSFNSATKVIQAATATNALTLEVWLAPDNTTQTGPARIVTCSDSPTTRNFTLGQGVFGAGGDRWVMRLRTTETDTNGTPQTATDPGTLTTNLTHVAVTRDATGGLGIYVDGALVETAYVGGSLQNWDPSFALALGGELTDDRHWQGTYHLVAIYGRALDHTEVIENFNAGPQGVPQPTAPVFVSDFIPAAAVGLPYTYQVLATGYPAPTVALVDPPAGMAIDPVTGLVTWTPDSAGVVPVEITATNATGTASQSFDLTVFAESPLDLQVWYGLDQRVGHLGDQQADFNLLGNVTPVGDVASLGYFLNGGIFRELNLGPDGIRLVSAGDYNADIPITQLQPGANTVTVQAVDTIGFVTTAEVTVTLETGGSQALPVSIDWSATSDPQDVGQYVDGLWEKQGDGIRTLQPGYDRIFLIGETDWQDYDVLVPVTIHQVLAAGNPPGLGILMRFTGHVVDTVRWPLSGTNPKWGYQPFGGIGWLRWVDGPANQPKMQFYRGDDDTEINHGSPPAALGPTRPDEFGALQHSLEFGTANVVPGGTYWIRMRCETLPDTPEGEGVTRYSWKIWDQGETEPENWSWTPFEQISPDALRRGGVGLLAHHVDATFGDVEVIEVSNASPVPGPVAGRIVLHQNHPNPFNPLTIIRMEVSRPSPARLAVFDLQGRLVRTLFRGELPAGPRDFRWDGRDEGGRATAGGVYLLRLDASGESQTRKMTLVR